MTKTTVKRISFCLTKDLEKQLNELCELLSDNKSQVIKRCINELHHFLTRKSEKRKKI